MSATLKPIKSVEVINISGAAARFEIEHQLIELRPLEKVKILEAFALPRTLQAGRDPIASVVDLQTGGRVVHVGDPRAKVALIALENKR